jgi:hypothetical protein
VKESKKLLLKFNGADPKQHYERVFNPALSQQEDGQFWQGAWNGVTQPHQKAWNEGRPAEAIGRGIFDIAMLGLGMRQLGKTLAGKPPATQSTAAPPSTVFTTPPQTTGTLPGVNQPPKPTLPTVLPPTNGQPFTGRPVVPPAPTGRRAPTVPEPPAPTTRPPVNETPVGNSPGTTPGRAPQTPEGNSPVPKPTKNEPTSGSVTGEPPKVTAKATVGGSTFNDTNQGARVGGDPNKPTLIADQVAAKKLKKPGKEYPNGNMADAHAEVGAIQQAFEAKATVGKDMKMTVTGQPVCPYCRSDIPKMAKAAGLKSLTIYEEVTKQTLYWEPGKKLKPIKPVE